MKRKKSIDSQEEANEDIVSEPNSKAHTQSESEYDVGDEDKEHEQTPSKSRRSRSIGAVSNGSSHLGETKTQSATTKKPKRGNRELARLQWESEGRKVSKARVEEAEHEEDSSSSDDELLGLGIGAGVLKTPSKGTPLRPGTASQWANGSTSLGTVARRNLFSTPAKNAGDEKVEESPRIQFNADRSARRKTTRNIIERTILGDSSDNDENDVGILRDIYASGCNDGMDHSAVPSLDEVEATPSKRGPGRPRKLKPRDRSPQPLHLPPHEMYFAQNHGRIQTSNNTLASLSLLDHEEYFSLIRGYQDPHAEDIEFLKETHAGTFNQWQFELNQDFNICVYGWGSKRSLLMKFAEHVYNTLEDPEKNKIVVVNGYVSNLTIKDVLNAVCAAVAERGQKLGSQPAEMLETLTSLLEKDRSQHITLIINSIDRTPLRRPATQIILSRLCSHPQISLVASADHPSFPLLWDTSLRSMYNFLFHDCTTFEPYTAEVDVVDEVHELLGRSGRRVGGKEGISFVLKSLPENAKNLFRVLVAEQLIAMAEDGADEDDNEERFESKEEGVEYRVLFNKAAEEFICSNEMNFRTLLKEFHDHQMVHSRKDALGTEFLSVPFRKEELETILEDIA